MTENRDLRKYASQTNLRIILGAIFLVIAVGGGLIYLIYGPRAAVMGILCIGLGLIPIILIGVMLFGLEWIVRRDRRE